MNKRILSSITGTLFSALLFLGCTTTGGNSSITPDRVQAITRLAAYASGVGLAMSQPQYIPALVAARDVACELKRQEKWDVIALTEALRVALSNQLSSTEGVIVVSGIPMLVDAFTGAQIDLRTNEYAKAFVIGVCDGLSAINLGGKASAVKDVNTGREVIAVTPWIDQDLYEKFKGQAEASRPPHFVRKI